MSLSTSSHPPSDTLFWLERFTCKTIPGCRRLQLHLSHRNWKPNRLQSPVSCISKNRLVFDYVNQYVSQWSDENVSLEHLCQIGKVEGGGGRGRGGGVESRAWARRTRTTNNTRPNFDLLFRHKLSVKFFNFVNKFNWMAFAGLWRDPWMVTGGSFDWN